MVGAEWSRERYPQVGLVSSVYLSRSLLLLTPCQHPFLQCCALLSFTVEASNMFSCPTSQHSGAFLEPSHPTARDVVCTLRCVALRRVCRFFEITMSGQEVRAEVQALTAEDGMVFYGVD